MLLGIYKNYDELEENLTIDEVNRIIAASRKKTNEANRFAAALKGVKLSSPEEEEDKDLPEKVKRRAAARRRGLTLEEYNGKMDALELQQNAGIRMEVDKL